MSDTMCGQSHFWWTEPFRNQHVETRRGTLEYADVGSGPPVLYFHGTGAANDAVILMEKGLLDDGFRMIVPNRPGYYGTPLSSGRSPQDCADIACELLDTLNISRVAVVGTSGGGLAASAFAAHHPARTSCLVMQCALAHPFTSPRWMPPQIWIYFPLFRYQRIFLPILQIGYRMEMRKLKQKPHYFLNYLSGQRSAELHDDEATKSLIPLLIEQELRCAQQPSGIENDWANDVGPPWLVAGAVHCPTLILHDRLDLLVTMNQIEWCRKCIPHAEYCDLHVGGHLIWVGKEAEKMRQTRTAFLRRNVA